MVTLSKFNFHFLDIMPLSALRDSTNREFIDALIKLLLITSINEGMCSAGAVGYISPGRNLLDELAFGEAFSFG